MPSTVLLKRSPSNPNTFDPTKGSTKVNSTFYYFGYDALGSQIVVLNSTGGVIGSQLYGPYGNQRYNNGSLPTSIGFTGQRADSVTGLDYYNARYYDPVVGVFLSVDSVQGNAQRMDPYACVSGNPETRTDPTGKIGFIEYALIIALIAILAIVSLRRLQPTICQTLQQVSSTIDGEQQQRVSCR